MKPDPHKLTIRHAQTHQPWTVPYAAAIDVAAAGDIPHILGTHTVLHAMKSLGKIAAVFEALDHSRDVGEHGKSEPMSDEQWKVVAQMSADLFTAALRFANLYAFDLATVLVGRIREKNGVDITPWE